MVFFVISGYVITKKPISLLHEGRREDFVEAINSAMIRRPLRLFLPVVWSTLFFACAWHIFGIATPWPEHRPNIFAELVTWCEETSAFFYFFRTGFLFTWYNPHTWTIPVELRGSMFLFVWLFSLHQIPNRFRILMTVGMVLHLAIGSSGAWYACFFAGMLTAELDLLASESSGAAQIRLPWDAPLKALKNRRVLWATILHVMLLCGLLLAGQPSSDYMKKAELYGSCSGWRTLSHLIPPAYGDGDSTNRWFWLFWAAWMLLVAIKEIDWVRRLFEARFSQCESLPSTTHVGHFPPWPWFPSPPHSTPPSPCEPLRAYNHLNRPRQNLLCPLSSPRPVDRNLFRAAVLPCRRKSPSERGANCAYWLPI